MRLKSPFLKKENNHDLQSRTDSAGQSAGNFNYLANLPPSFEAPML